MEGYLFAPLVVLVLGGMFMQLVDVAERSSDKVIVYAQDADKAMDCALKGIPVVECSPGLFETDFTEELNDYSNTVTQLSRAD